MTIKTTSQAIADSSVAPAIIRDVVRLIGADSISYVNNHCIDGGFNGFTYTSDTVAFFKRHRKAIVEMVTNMADDLGENPVDMVCGFNYLGGRSGDENEYHTSVSRCLFGGRLTDDDDNVANSLAWFAAEEACRAFEE